MTADQSPIVRGLVFGSIATQYDTHRPTYPAALFDDVVDLLPGPRVVEIGAGTGKASTELAARELALTCVEPDPRMAEVLAGRCPGTEIVAATLESWRPVGHYDGMVSAQAWHWTEPSTRWTLAAAALRPGGLIALWWNRDPPGDAAVHRAVDKVYEAHGIADTERPYGHHEHPDPWPADELAAHPAFELIGVRSYPAPMMYSAAGYAALLDTSSHHRLLPRPVRESLAASVTKAIAEHGGQLPVARRADLYLGRRT